MKVLFAGYSKCGTKTMNVVFRTLGYSCYDIPEHFMMLGDDWIRIFEKGLNPGDLKNMYSDVDTAVDIPVFHFWEEFLEAFPDLKLIVSYREEEEWLESVINQMEVITKDRKMKAISMLSPTAQKYLRGLRISCNALWGGDKRAWPWQVWTGINLTLLLKTYRRHNAYLRQKAPQDRILVVDFKDGWEPICKFLGKPVPDELFPHANKAGKILEEMMKTHPLFHKMIQEALLTMTILVVLFAVLLIYFYQVFF